MKMTGRFSHVSAAPGPGRHVRVDSVIHEEHVDSMFHPTTDILPAFQTTAAPYHAAPRELDYLIEEYEATRAPFHEDMVEFRRRSERAPPRGLENLGKPPTSQAEPGDYIGLAKVRVAVNDAGTVSVCKRNAS
jgi:hypothetical protein